MRNLYSERLSLGRLSHAGKDFNNTIVNPVSSVVLYLLNGAAVQVNTESVSKLKGAAVQVYTQA